MHAPLDSAVVEGERLAWADDARRKRANLDAITHRGDAKTTSQCSARSQRARCFHWRVVDAESVAAQTQARALCGTRATQRKIT